MSVGTELKKIGRQLDPSSWKSEDWGKAALVGGLAASGANWTGREQTGTYIDNFTNNMSANYDALSNYFGGDATAVEKDTSVSKLDLELSGKGIDPDGLTSAQKLNYLNQKQLVQGQANPLVDAGARLGAAYIGAEATENSQRMMLEAAEERDKASANKLGLAQSAFVGGY